MIDAAELRPTEGTWSFACSACGNCCNSAPAMALPELLHHQSRFVGCLAVRRHARLSAGQRLGIGPRAARATEDDARAAAALSASLTFRVGGGAGDPTACDVFVGTHALSLGEGAACPALGPDGACAIHGDRKPAACEVVPLDALLPDRVQHAVLSQRRAEAAYFGADCIAPGPRPDAATWTVGPALVHEGAARALARRRTDLEADKRFWGGAVFRLLANDLFLRPESLARLPQDGFLILSIAPVLVVVAAASPRALDRCRAYVDAQLALIDATLRGAGTGQPHRAAAQLTAFAKAYRALAVAFARGAPAGERRSTDDVAALERWLGVDVPISPRNTP